MKFMKLFEFVILFPLLVLLSCSGNQDPKVAFQKGKYETAYELWKPLAMNGDAEAQNYLGIQYTLGLGVNKDYKEAVKWYEMAARTNFPDAQKNYGDMFYNGRGVSQDYYKAFIWYFAASQQGHQIARNALENLTSQNKLTPNQQMHAKLEANNHIPDPSKRFISHDTYINK